MLSYASTQVVAPVGFNEGKDHWVFKYWTGSAVEKAQQIVREVCEENHLPNWFPSGRIRTEYATCAVQHSFNIFCRCCAISNVTQTLVRIVGNLVAQYCDLDEYVGGGLEYLENYDSIMAKDRIEALELTNLRDILSGTYTWIDLVRRIYSRRHWMAVRELVVYYVRKWIAFFDEVQKRKEPFTEHEKQSWNQLLFKFSTSEIHEGSFLLTRAQVERGAYRNACDALAFSEANKPQEQVILILGSRLRHNTHGKWAESSKSICRRRRFIDIIVDAREKQRRAINMIRLMEDPDSVFLPSPPNSMTLSYFGSTEDIFTFPNREIHLCEKLAENPRFDIDAYWPIYTEFSGEYRHCILQLDSPAFVAALETILLSLGELTCATVWIGPPELSMQLRIIVAFIVNVELNTVDMIADILAECAAAKELPICVQSLELGRPALIQLCADIVSEQECEILRYN